MGQTQAGLASLQVSHGAGNLSESIPISQVSTLSSILLLLVVWPGAPSSVLVTNKLLTKGVFVFRVRGVRGAAKEEEPGLDWSGSTAGLGYKTKQQSSVWNKFRHSWKRCGFTFGHIPRVSRGVVEQLETLAWLNLVGREGPECLKNIKDRTLYGHAMRMPIV